MHCLVRVEGSSFFGRRGGPALGSIFPCQWIWDYHQVAGLVAKRVVPKSVSFMHSVWLFLELDSLLEDKHRQRGYRLQIATFNSQLRAAPYYHHMVRVSAVLLTPTR